MSNFQFPMSNQIQISNIKRNWQVGSIVPAACGAGLHCLVMVSDRGIVAPQPFGTMEPAWAAWDYGASIDIWILSLI